MPLPKRGVSLSFGQGLDTKTDPFQIAPGKLLRLQNTVYNKIGLLTKRNGFGYLPTLPDETNNYLTTYNGNLTAIGSKLNALNDGSKNWVTRGNIQPAKLSVSTLVRSGTNQSSVDVAIAPNGLVCTVFTDNVPVMGSNVAQYKYVISDNVTGQNIIIPTLIPVITGVIDGSPRIFLLGNYFVIVVSVDISGVHHLQYIAISISNPSLVGTVTNISSNYTPSDSVAFDGVVANNNLYLAWNGNDGGGAIRVTYLESTLSLHSTVVYSGNTATVMSVTADTSGPNAIIYASFADSGVGYTLAFDQATNAVLAPTQIINGMPEIPNITSTAIGGICTVVYETANAYSYDAAIPTNFVSSITITMGGTAGSPAIVLRSVGLASKSFFLNAIPYVLVVYGSDFQPTYFLTDLSGNICAKLAYSNGGGYLTVGLPSVSVSGFVAQIPYLFKDLVESVNKTQGAASSAGVYSQTGINLSQFDLKPGPLTSAEIGHDLHISGGFMWMYDGQTPVEHGFHVWPDSVELTGDTMGGALTAQQYFYQVIYQWADGQGNLHRSAPSIPVSVTTTGTTSSVTIDIPTLRLTYKIQTPVTILIYRWSTAQESYYQVTSVLTPLLNDPTVDSVEFVDILADGDIVGNSLIYTTGGVVENIGAPATSSISLFKSRLFLIDSEDPNLLWYSKQVIEATPVEMSDLFTIYVSPTTGAHGSTGDLQALAPMDDKLILFKKDAIYYLTGVGPDNTGANNDFSDPVFITSTVGCANQNSIVFMPNGLMFQSDKGIWLLGRDLSTTYIGAPVEEFNSSIIQSAVAVPETNEVRFTLENGVILLYDYFQGQWGTFVGTLPISSTLYQGLHTLIDIDGRAFQETPGLYVDGAAPVLVGLTTGWLDLEGLQGFERAYSMYLIGTYISPHKLFVRIAYDYAQSPEQVSIIQPDNFNPPYGGDSPYGASNPYGGMGNLEQWRIFFNTQKCQAFQVLIDEQFDPSFGTVAGAGFTLSGMDLVVGAKSTWPRLSAARSVG